MTSTALRTPRANGAKSRRPERTSGIISGGLEHQILLALRAPGGMTSDQVYLRFSHPSTAMCRLRRGGLIVTPPPGYKGMPINLTAVGRALVAADGPLARSKSLITYCQL